MPQANRSHTTTKPRRGQPSNVEISTLPICCLPRVLTPAARKLVDDAMAAHWRALEGLTAFLDAADGDTDMEPGGDDEPSLGAHGSTYNAENGGATYSFDVSGGDDRETEHDGREPPCEDEGAQCDDEGADTGDLEPSLGSLNPCILRSQSGWANNVQDE